MFTFKLMLPSLTINEKKILFDANQNKEYVSTDHFFLSMPTLINIDSNEEYGHTLYFLILGFGFKMTL